MEELATTREGRLLDKWSSIEENREEISNKQRWFTLGEKTPILSDADGGQKKMLAEKFGITRICDVDDY